MMKLAVIPLIALILLLAGCTQNPPSTSSTTTFKATTVTSTTTTLPVAEYTGFMKLHAGQWVEYSLPKGLGEKMYYLGEDELGGKKAAGIEVQLRNKTSYLGTFQLWVDPNTKELIKYVGRINGEVLCANTGNISKQFPNFPPLEGTPDKYLPGKDERKEYITLVSGETVYCAKFSINHTTVLVSSSVPFGIVRATNENGTLMDLTGYGTGMKRTITKKEAEDCTPI
jgi:hypothetical protein